MAERENQLSFSSNRLYLGLILAGILATAAFPMITMAGGGGLPSDTCTASNGFCGPIRFIEGLTANATSQNDASFSLSSNTWNAFKNETMIVVGSSVSSFIVSGISAIVSVTDSFGDIFTLVRREAVASSLTTEPPVDEVWTGIVGQNGVDSVTATWNATNVNGNLLEVLLYTNILSIGQSTGLGGVLNPSNNTLTLTVQKSGAWIFGTTATQQAVISCPSGAIVSDSPGFVTRVKDCSISGGGTGTETWDSDNATSLRNGVSISYGVTLASFPVAQVAAAVELEIEPADAEPQHQIVNTSSFCLNTGDTCHVAQANKASGINTNQNIIVNTAYCTGITTSALTVSGASAIDFLVTYAGQSRNDTGAEVLVQVYVSNNAPSTSFASGLCAAGGSIIGFCKLVLFTSGATNTAYGPNEYHCTIDASIVVGGFLTGTDYVWIEITPQSVGNILTGVANAGSTIQYAQWGAVNHSSISLVEIK